MEGQRWSRRRIRGVEKPIVARSWWVVRRFGELGWQSQKLELPGLGERFSPGHATGPGCGRRRSGKPYDVLTRLLGVRTGMTGSLPALCGLLVAGPLAGPWRGSARVVLVSVVVVSAGGMSVHVPASTGGPSSSGTSSTGPTPARISGVGGSNSLGLVAPADDAVRRVLVPAQSGLSLIIPACPCSDPIIKSTRDRLPLRRGRNPTVCIWGDRLGTKVGAMLAFEVLTPASKLADLLFCTR